MGEITRKHHYTVDLDRPLIWRYSGLLLATGDDNGDEFFITLRKNGKNIVNSGDTQFIAYFIRPDDVTVPMECENSNGVVHVALDKSCYKCAGRFVLTVKSEAEDTTALAIIDGYIKQTSTDSIVDPDEKIVSLPELIEMVDELEQTTEEANNVIAELEEAKESGQFKGEKGDKGDKGDPGKTPVMGEDYWTMEDQLSMFIDVVEETKKYVPTINASKSGKVTTLTITDKNGTKTATINDGSDGAAGKDGQNGKDGTSVTVTNVSQSTADGGSNVVTFSDGKTLTVKNGSKGSTGAAGKDGSDANVTAANITKALGYTPMNAGEYGVSVTQYGAKGDGTTDDTVAFQNALAANRKVYVPGGTYKLSGELVIGLNCQLELAQDAFLDFKQTSGNCISMRAGSNIIGNHATINVPYAFTGKAICIYAGIDSGIFGVPPLKTGKWGPMWAAARYITDLHIVKLNYGGIARSVDGTCSGTAVYLKASYKDSMNFLWAVDLNKLRIAGGFTYGIHLDSEINPADPMDGWIHQTKIDGFITGCEVAVYLKDSTLSYISVRITPDWGSDNNARYCKHGIVLENSTNVDLSQSRVMDWDTNHTLWEEGNQYQHLALLGNTAGLILSEHYYYDSPNNDIRSLIYTDNPANLEKLTILQEPFTRWFKPKNGVPYFNDGFTEKKLLLQEELDDCFQTDRVPDFEDALYRAINKDGTSFNNGLGYYPYGKRWVASSGELTDDDPYFGCTGLIPIKAGDTVYTSQITWADSGNECAVIFDSNFKRTLSCTALTVNGMTYYFGYEKTDEGFALTVKSNPETASAAYVAITFERSRIGDNPLISVNTPITFSQQGFLVDGISVKDNNIVGTTLERASRKVTAISAASTNDQYPSAKCVYDALQGALGAYVDDIASLIGGDA